MTCILLLMSHVSSSFTYRSKRPMNPIKFKAFTDALCARAPGDPAAQVVRAKGFVWLAGQPKTQVSFAPQ